MSGAAVPAGKGNANAARSIDDQAALTKVRRIRKLKKKIEK
jgi:hypothetical protein